MRGSEVKKRQPGGQQAGPVARRRAAARWGETPGSTYSGANLAGEMGLLAASDTLYGDILVCEDACRHERPFSRKASDYEKFYNTIQLTCQLSAYIRLK